MNCTNTCDFQRLVYLSKIPKLFKVLLNPLFKLFFLFEPFIASIIFLVDYLQTKPTT